MHELHASKRDCRTRRRLESKHWAHASLDATMVLFDDVIEVATLSNRNARHVVLASRFVGAFDRRVVRRAAIDRDGTGALMLMNRSPEKALRGRCITPLAEVEVNRMSGLIHGAVLIHPRAAHADISFVHSPVGTDIPFMTTERREQRQRKARDPAGNVL